MRTSFYFLLVLFVTFSAHEAVASGIMKNGYTVYRGDVNDDGREDLYFEYNRPVILIHGDIASPLVMPQLPNFVLYLNRGSESYKDPVEISLTEQEVANLDQLEDSLSVFGDFNGDDATDLLFIDTMPLVIHAQGNGLPELVQTLSVENRDDEISYAAAILTSVNPDSIVVLDENNDGRADISVGDFMFHADESGVFGSYTTPTTIQAPNMAGTSGGQFRVSESGAATYSFPIATATGTAGVVPEISLNYSSSGSNGLVGKGWAIGGLSGISRCRQTLSIDGNVGPINWTDSDRFCLDGQRLITVNDSQYGAVGAVYKTEMDSFVKVTSLGGSLGNPNHFMVERKDGSVSYYGESDDSKQLVGGNVLTWAQNRFEDSVGNHIEYLYDGDSESGHRVSSIRYAYGSGFYEADVEFVYEDRPEHLRGYTAGYALSTTKRLDKIISSSNGRVIREYKLGYKPVLPFIPGEKYNDRTSLLTSLQECVDSNCLPAISFEWLQAPWMQYGTQSEAIDFSPTNNRFLSDYKYADFNGDGKQDIVWIEGYNDDGSDTDIRVKYAISYGSKFVKQNFTGGLFSSEYFTSANVGEGFSIRVLDYNGDGRHDLAIYNPRTTKYGIPGNYWHVFLSRYDTGSKRWKLDSRPISTGRSNKDAIFADFNGDGLADYISVSYSSSTGARVLVRLMEPSGDDVSSYKHYKFSDEYTSYPLNISGANSMKSSGRVPDTLGDFNGDGAMDILVATSAGFEAAVFDQEAGEFHSIGLFSTTNTSKSPIAVDINGDGLTDVAYPGNSGGLFGQLSTGTGFVSLGYLGGSKGTFVDLNNDGYQDFVWPVSYSDFIYVRFFDQNTGTFVDTDDRKTFDAIFPCTSQAKELNIACGDLKDNDFIWFADTNGDGEPDYHRYESSSGKVYTRLDNSKDSQYSNTPRNVIHKIDNGLDNITQITYENMVDGEVYSRLDVATSGSVTDFYSALNGEWILPSGSQTLGKDKPVLDILSPMYLVAKVESSAPAAAAAPGSVDQSALSSVSYHYHQMKLQAAGRGMLGFQKVSTTDNQTGVVTETTYRQDFPFVGMPLQTEARSAEGQLLSRASNNWRLQGWNGSGKPLPSYQPYIYQAVEETYDLKGAGSAQGELLQSVTTTNSYDTYGNALSIDVVTKDGISGDQFAKKTENTYGSNVWEKEKGRLTATKVTSSRPGMPSHIRESAFSYYASGIHKGLLKTEVIEPNKPEYKQITAYEYDNFGNVSKKTVTAPGEVARSARTLYDLSGRYVFESYNALDHLTERVVSRNHFGAPLEVKGMNGLETVFAYDGFGRETISQSNTGADKLTDYDRCVIACPAGAQYMVTTHSSTGSWSREYFDALGRSIRTETKGFNSKIYTDKEYDNLGRVKFASEPYFSGDTRLWSKMEYDLLGRPSRVTAPDGSVSSITYSGLETITTNDKGQQKTEIKNVAGELVEVIDAIDGRLTYEYDSQGNLYKAKSWGKTNAAGAHIDEGDGLSYPIVVTIEYDDLGRKTRMDDPDKGEWHYEYTGFGELKKQTNANGHTVELTYDELGRQSTRIEKSKGSSAPTSDVIWLYDSAANGLGLVEMVMDSVSGYQAVYEYDQVGRNHIQAVDFDGAGTQPSYVTTTVFDGHGRVEYSYDALDSILDGGKSGTQNFYNTYGYLYKVVDLATGDLIQEVKAQTARGQLKEQLLGNGATSNFTFEAASGRLTKQTSTVLGAFGIQDISYQWDTLGNLTSRHNQSGSKDLRESFCYDKLNRLIKTHIGNSNVNCSGLSTSEQDIRYNAIGNITFKAGVGDYIYGENGAGPHAVTTAGGVSYNYDLNGNMTSDGFDGGRTISYTTFDKASLIKKGNNTTEFLYGPSHSRYYRKDTNSSNGEVTETWYIGGIERIQKSSKPNEIEWKRHLVGTAVYTVKTDKEFKVLSTDKLFLYKDHLGSMDLITDKAGKVVQEMSFDAWGQRRNSANWNALSLTALSNFDHSRTTRGYTGHEMLDEVGLIHMNGRIYDPRLGRFMQADLIVDGKFNTQGYNRYSYGKNSPLSGVDPSGYGFFSEVFDDILGITESSILNAVAQAAACYYGGPAGCAAYAAASAKGHGASWGDAFKAGAIAYVSAYAFGEIGTGYEAGAISLGEAALYSGLVGGTMSVLQGGKFGHGFVSAGAMAATGPLIGNIGNRAARVTGRAILGGTISKLTGGKFANGAATGAFHEAVSSRASDKNISDDDLVGKMVPEVQWNQLDDAAAYQYAAEGLAAMEGDLNVDQGALRVAQYRLGAHRVISSLAASTLTSKEVSWGVFNHNFYRDQKYIAIGGAGVLCGGFFSACTSGLSYYGYGQLGKSTYDLVTDPSAGNGYRFGVNVTREVFTTMAHQGAPAPIKPIIWFNAAVGEAAGRIPVE
ncbi:FG-GAP-like repeat-containing protein [Microbulbifer sp. TRSA005]|uniref:FG-GAP-like repeat-containing protein n=1 Tax=Microbulbifer sp. TRSA005 TaxID=3243383 RepID=UPI00403A43E5